DVAVRGYDAASYGEAFADVYDDWYGEISDVGATVRLLAALTPAGADVLELGVGTGRLAIPLAARLVAQGSRVDGLDASPAMLTRLAANDPTGSVRAVLGEMGAPLPPGPYGLVFVAYNTFFALPTAEQQANCFAAVAARLGAGGAFVIESFVPGDEATDRQGTVTVRAISAGQVVLSVSRANPVEQTMEGQYVDISEAGGVRLRPWSIRWSSPVELDAMAAAAGLALAGRWESFAGERYDADSPRQVSAYARPADRAETSSTASEVLG
ncbi:MAG: class I SAM-dependent methyltransferase, partial [Ilumatobacteraceae bacterium]